MIQIVDNVKSTRLQYVLTFLNTHFLETPLISVHEHELNRDLPFLRYTHHPIDANDLYKSGLTEETRINKLYHPQLPANPDEFNLHRHDIISIIFYFLSRYEEYLPFSVDKHNRFEASQHLHFPEKIKRAWVDECCIYFSQFLLKLFPTIRLKKRQFSFINTIDVDNAFAFCSKSILRNGVGALRDLSKLKLKAVADRFLCIPGIKTDPFLSHKSVKSLLENQFPTYYFLLLADYAENDRAVNTSTKAYKKMVKEMAEFASLGWHPGYEGFIDEAKWDKEHERFKKITGEYPIRSRQHFLRLRFPDTYRKLIEYGIKEDFTQGFASETGFRAGTANWFYFFDLQENKQKDLKLFPFSIMEGIYKYYKKKRDFKSEVETLIDYHIQHQLPFTWLWHNDSISGYAKWTGWDKDYAGFIAKIKYAAGNQ